MKSERKITIYLAEEDYKRLIRAHLDYCQANNKVINRSEYIRELLATGNKLASI